jgi:dolichol-phosphate mannosyltransferase
MHATGQASIRGRLESVASEVPRSAAPHRLFVLGLTALTVARIAYAALAPPSGDEVYLWQWSRHPGLSYYDQPAWIAYQIAATTLLCGDTVLGIRLASPLIFAAIAAVVYVWGRREWGDRVGALAGLIIAILPVACLGAIVAAVDTPLALFWLLATWCAWRAVADDRPAHFLLAGVFLLLGCVTKYLMVLWVPALFAWLAWDPVARPWLRRPYPWLAVAIGALSAIPFAVWNEQHGWTAVEFNLEARHDFGFDLAHVARLWAAQLALASPVLFVVIAIAVGRSARVRGADRRASLVRLLCSATLALPVAITAIGLAAPVSPLWIATGYPCAALLAAAWVCEPFGGRTRGRWLKVGVALCVAIVLPVHVLVFRPDLVLRGGWLDALGRPDKLGARQLKDFYGWRELAARVGRQLEIPANDGSVPVIITPKTTLSSYLAFFVEGQPDTYLYRERAPDGTVVGESSAHGLSYLFWQDLERLRGRDAVFVTARRDDVTVRRFAVHCAALELVDESPVVLDGRELQRFYIYRARRLAWVGRDG